MSQSQSTTFGRTRSGANNTQQNLTAAESLLVVECPTAAYFEAVGTKRHLF
jgi:hypothetical protein